VSYNADCVSERGENTLSVCRRRRQAVWGERGAGATKMTIDVWEVVSSSLLKGGDEGEGTLSVVVIAKPHW
jgi:hypothetical protein